VCVNGVKPDASTASDSKVLEIVAGSCVLWREALEKVKGSQDGFASCC